MAEMTSDMYGAVGRVGNKVFYQRGGKTIARTITRPKNPKTEAQSLHRVLVKAVNKAYSMLKGICNHSFEEYDNSFDCMNKFTKVFQIDPLELIHTIEAVVVFLKGMVTDFLQHAICLIHRFDKDTMLGLGLCLRIFWPSDSPCDGLASTLVVRPVA